jgi:hypothetical protein
MQVFIVMQESIYEGSSHWQIDSTFASMESAKAYIAQRKAEYRGYYDVPEFDIEVENVCA